MKDHMKIISLICIMALSVIGQTSVPAPTAMGERARQSRISKRDYGLRVSEEAFANPFNEDKVKAYMTMLPQDDGLYVLEGDLLFTEQELRAYLVVKSQSEKPVDSSAELIVNVHEGQRDYYANLAQRTLSYSVDRQSFPSEAQYSLTVDNMRLATSDWEVVCPDCKVKFVYQKASDLNPSTEKVNFVVRFRDVGGAYIAASFFPHDGPARRYLNIDPSYFQTSFNKTGVLRHELGHILGYRHEHTRGVVGCFFEDNNWQPLTEYDPKSVMHYFCGGGGNLNLDLTDVDKNGHRRLYGPTQAIGQSPGNLRIRFDGPDLSKSLPQVLDTLSKLGLVGAKTYTVKKDGESLKSVYANTLQLPVISNALVAYASDFNKRSVATKKLLAGQEILYPDVQFKTFKKLVVLDPKVKKDLQTYNDIWNTWPASLITESKQEQGSDAVSLLLKGYELNLHLNSFEADTKARSALRDLKKTSKANYLVLSVPSQSLRPASLYSLPGGTPSHSLSSIGRADPFNHPSPASNRQSVDDFYARVLAGSGHVEAGLEGDLSLLLGEVDDMQFPASCTNDCPQIILMDHVVSLHPDIADAIKEGGAGNRDPDPIDATTNQQNIRIESTDGILPAQHGTYMAGIIASRQNGFGLIGINPRAEISSFDWESLVHDPQQLADLIVERQAESINATKRMQIFVFATEWNFKFPLTAPKERFDNGNLEDPDPYRELANQIQLARPLIIVAVGQPQGGASPEALSRISPEGPRNLGDLENVIVVTAYEQLPTEPGGTRPKPQLWSMANSLSTSETERIVHVAAPGLMILSTIPNSGASESAPYGRGSGTSQATAFVAGVVSSMVSAWPRYYGTDAALVKTRLQLTSDPFIRRSDANKLAAGVINYNLAMHDQSKNWFKPSGGDTTFAEVPHPKWLVPEIRVHPKEEGLPDWLINPKKIYRIMYRDGLCYFYLAGAKPGEIQKIGPGTLSATEVTHLPLFELKRKPNEAAIPYTLNEISDLLLATPH